MTSQVLVDGFSALHRARWPLFAGTARALGPRRSAPSRPITHPKRSAISDADNMSKHRAYSRPQRRRCTFPGFPQTPCFDPPARPPTRPSVPPILPLLHPGAMRSGDALRVVMRPLIRESGDRLAGGGIPLYPAREQAAAEARRVRLRFSFGIDVRYRVGDLSVHGASALPACDVSEGKAKSKHNASGRFLHFSSRMVWPGEDASGSAHRWTRFPSAAGDQMVGAPLDHPLCCPPRPVAWKAPHLCVR